jgi:hypothetical protein
MKELYNVWARGGLVFIMVLVIAFFLFACMNYEEVKSGDLGNNITVVFVVFILAFTTVWLGGLHSIHGLITEEEKKD